jgi:hypothetical protein
MSLYNMLMGFNPACVAILPMLGRKENEYPRFRDCYVTDEGNIAIYTRVGGGNRDAGFGEEELYKDENFLTTYDDEYDSTYGTYEFKVPEKWKADFDKIIDGRSDEVSNEYLTYVKEFYPKLAAEGVIDKIFGKVAE